MKQVHLSALMLIRVLKTRKIFLKGTFRTDNLKRPNYFAINRELTTEIMRLILIKYFNQFHVVLHLCTFSFSILKVKQIYNTMYFRLCYSLERKLRAEASNQYLCVCVCVCETILFPSAPGLMSH